MNSKNNVNSSKKNILFVGSYFNEINFSKDFDIVIQLGNHFRLSKNNNIEIPTSNWDNKTILHEDYKKIRNIYETLLELLMSSEKFINQYEDLDINKRNLEILLGVWLRAFIIIVYKTVKEFENLSQNNNYTVLGAYKLSEIEKRPICMDDFIRNKRNDDDQLDNLKIDILKNLGLISEFNIFWINDKEKKKIKLNKKKFQNSKKLIGKILKFSKSIAIDFLLFLFNNFPNKKYLVCDPDIFSKLKFRIKKLSKISYSLHKYSFSNLLYENKLKSIKNKSKKIKIIKGELNKNKIEDKVLNIIEKLMPIYIPNSLFSGIKYSIKRSNFIFPKGKTKNIITASNILKDEIFDLFIIKSLKYGSKFFIIQHGGGYGFSKVNDEEEYQLNIADYFISWGWKESSTFKPSQKYLAKIISNYGCIIKKPLRDINNKYKTKQKKVFIALNEWNITDIRLYSFPSSDRIYEKQNEMIKFLKNLKFQIREKVVLRGFMNMNKENSLKATLSEIFGDLNYIDREKSLLSDNLTSDSYLFITDSNSTSWLEALYLDVPSILLICNELKDINLRKFQIFKKCIDNNLIFDCPIKASNWINNNIKYLDNWWGLKEVQNCRTCILNNFYNGNFSANEMIDYIDKGLITKIIQD